MLVMVMAPALCSGGVGSQLWATKGTPTKVREFVWQLHNKGISRSECVKRLESLLDRLEAKRTSELPGRFAAGGGAIVIFVYEQVRHQSVCVAN